MYNKEQTASMLKHNSHQHSSQSPPVGRNAVEQVPCKHSLSMDCFRSDCVWWVFKRSGSLFPHCEPKALPTETCSVTPTYDVSKSFFHETIPPWSTFITPRAIFHSDNSLTCAALLLPNHFLWTCVSQRWVVPAVNPTAPSSCSHKSPVFPRTTNEEQVYVCCVSWSIFKPKAPPHFWV